MHIELLVEEPSAEEALNILLPKIIGKSCTFKIHPFQGKDDLLGKLPNRLKGYKAWLPFDWKIVILLDEDRKDCVVLKKQVEGIAHESGFSTGSAWHRESLQVAIRIAVEELEAWYFGDVPALCGAYPRVPATLDKKAGYRNPDTVRGGTWEGLERVLKRAGYYTSGLAKIKLARDIASRMDPARNRSKSFQVFRDLLQQFCP